MRVDGECYCGLIAFEAEIDPEKTSLCHCDDCQRLSGTAFRISAHALAGTVRLLRGTPKQFVKIASSGNRRIQAFCGTCGTAVYAVAADQVGPVNIRVATLRQRADIMPRMQIWRRSALPWIPLFEWLTNFDQDIRRDTEDRRSDVPGTAKKAN